MIIEKFQEIGTPKSVKLCMLLPPQKCKIKIEGLKEVLLGFSCEDIIPKTLSEKTDLKIERLDKLLESKFGPLSLLTKIDVAETIAGTKFIYIFGKYEEYSSFTFRDTRYYYPLTAPFELLMIPNDDNTEIFMLILLKKTKGTKLIRKLRDYLGGLGLTIILGMFEESDLEEIPGELDGELIDVILKDFVTPKIAQKRIYGKAFENDESYLRDLEESKMYSHQMTVSNPIEPGKKITIGLSRDGFVRFYNNTSYEIIVAIFEKLKDRISYPKEKSLRDFVECEGKLFEKKD